MIRVWEGSKVRLWIVFAAILLTIAFGAIPLRADDIQSVWAKNPITIDGRTTEWVSVAGKFLSEQNASIAVSNDQEFVYFTFRTTDIKWVRAITMTGITFYIDDDGGKSKDFYVKYFDGPSLDDMRSLDGRDGDVPGRMGGFARGGERSEEEASSRLLLYIKDQIEESEIPLDGSRGPAAAFDTCQGFYTYELCIPLVDEDTSQYTLGIDPDKKIGIGCVFGEISGAKGEERSGERSGGSMDSDMGGGRGGGMGGGRGGGMGGGGRGGGMGGGRGGGMRGGGTGGERPDMPTKQEVWFKSVLAQQPEPVDNTK